MDVSTMSPHAKLLRLRQLHLAILQCPPIVPSDGIPAPALALLEEQAAILKTVGVPPPHLAENPDPAAWASEFAATFRNIEFETALAWFTQGMGHAAETERKRNDSRDAALRECVDTLVLVREGLKAGRIKAPAIIDGSAPVGSPARPLVLLIVEALAKAGVTG